MPPSAIVFRFNAVNVAISPFKRRQTPLFFRFNAVNATMFPVKRCQRRYFSGSTFLFPIIYQLKAVTATIFWIDVVNTAISPVKRR